MKLPRVDLVEVILGLGILILAVFLIAGCKRAAPTWHGIPAGGRCAWSEDVGTCVAGGAVYTCVHDYQNNHNECAPITPPLHPEAP